MEKLLEANITSNIFDSYDVIWEDSVIEESELAHRLLNPYDFIEVNMATA